MKSTTQHLMAVKELIKSSMKKFVSYLQNFVHMVPNKYTTIVLLSMDTNCIQTFCNPFYKRSVMLVKSVFDCFHQCFKLLYLILDLLSNILYEFMPF